MRMPVAVYFVATEQQQIVGHSGLKTMMKDGRKTLLD